MSQISNTPPLPFYAVKILSKKPIKRVMDLVVFISALIDLIVIGLILGLSIRMSHLKRSYAQGIQSIKESFEELETKFKGDNSTWPKPLLAIPSRHNNGAYKKPILPEEEERTPPPPPTSPLKTKRW